MKKLLMLSVILGSVLLAGTKVNASDNLNKLITSKVNQKNYSHLLTSNVFPVTLTTDDKDGYTTWVVSCSALLSPNALVTFDTPCTETFADAYLEGLPVRMEINLARLGSYSSGTQKGKPFNYSGTPNPKDFTVQENGFSLFKLPVKTPEVKSAIANLPSLDGLSDANKGYLFRKGEAPAIYTMVGNGLPVKNQGYPANSLSGFRMFRKVLAEDLKHYATVLGGKMAVHERLDDNEYRDINGYAVFINSNGVAVITLESSLYSAYHSIFVNQFSRGVPKFYLNLAGMGTYNNGQGFFFNGYGEIMENGNEAHKARPILVKFDLPKDGPVYNKLQTTQEFFNHKTETLWLKDFAPRTDRMLQLMKK